LLVYINLLDGTDIHKCLSESNEFLSRLVYNGEKKTLDKPNFGMGKKDVHASGAHTLIIPQQGGFTLIYFPGRTSI